MEDRGNKRGTNGEQTGYKLPNSFPEGNPTGVQTLRLGTFGVQTVCTPKNSVLTGDTEHGEQRDEKK